ncbi:MAG: hypothetical protein JNL50_09295 [Phycisphaerae bacterium]|nr:hypothetical protein [Phycisphaerae bacterium]
MHQSDVGVWTVECLPVFERFGCPEIVALDDKGRCTVLNSYSGKWTPWVAVQDGDWLGGIAHADVDPRRPGRELYVGGKRGNLYQLCPHPQGGFDSNVIAYLPGKEIHTLAAAEIDGSRDGVELLAFTHPGGLYLLSPGPEPGSFTSQLLEELPGRVRDAVVLQDPNGRMIGVATVSRTGEVRLLRLEGGTPAWTTLYRTEMGLGRLAVKPSRTGEPLVLYVTCDDGRVVRLEQRADGELDAADIYVGPQGPRGLVAGRFHEDPGVESVALFGYSKKVQLLTRASDGWRIETIFEDSDKGHWLAVGEVDGRNVTDEILLCGYAERVVMLARPPGYGILPGTAVDRE